MDGEKSLLRGFKTACVCGIGAGIFLKLQECPAGTFRDDFVIVVRQPLQYGQEFLSSTIAHRDYSVAAEARPLGPTDRGAAKGRAEFFFGDPSEPIERRIDQAWASIELGLGCGRCFPVPRADILTYVAAEDVAAHA